LFVYVLLQTMLLILRSRALRKPFRCLGTMARRRLHRLRSLNRSKFRRVLPVSRSLRRCVVVVSAFLIVASRSIRLFRRWRCWRWCGQVTCTGCDRSTEARSAGYFPSLALCVVVLLLVSAFLIVASRSIRLFRRWWRRRGCAKSAAHSSHGQPKPLAHGITTSSHSVSCVVVCFCCECCIVQFVCSGVGAVGGGVAKLPAQAAIAQPKPVQQGNSLLSLCASMCCGWFLVSDCCIAFNSSFRQRCCCWRCGQIACRRFACSTRAGYLCPLAPCSRCFLVVVVRVFVGDFVR
jgi:hypothetical protein